MSIMLNKRGRRGIATGQIFIYILAALVTGMVIIIGYRAINSFMAQSERASFIQFKSELSSQVKSMASDYGSVTKIELTTPSWTRKVCFVDLLLNNPSTTTNSNLHNFLNANKLINSSWDAGVKANVFLLDKDGIREQLYLGDEDSNEIKPYFNLSSNHFLCIKPLNSRITLRAEGGNGLAILSEWT